MTNTTALRELLRGPEILIAPGIYDAFGALMVERADFPAAYLSGASIAYTRYGRPDLGLVGMDEVANVLSAIGERVQIPLIVDADTGYGNALNVIRTVKLFERNGAAVIQLEDQSLPKRCGHLSGKTLVSAAEMVGKIKAAVDARRSQDTLIMARTDAIAVEGLDAALERAERYHEAGAVRSPTAWAVRHRCWRTWWRGARRPSGPRANYRKSAIPSSSFPAAWPAPLAI